MIFNVVQSKIKIVNLTGHENCDRQWSSKTEPHSCALQFVSCHVVIIPTIYKGMIVAISTRMYFKGSIFRFYAVINVTHFAERNRPGCFIWIQNIKNSIQVSTIEWMMGAKFLS